MKKDVMNYKIGFFLIAVMTILLVSCKRQAKIEAEEETSVVVEYPVALIPEEIKTNLSDKDSLYPVLEDFLRDFMILFDRYQGAQVTVRMDFPTDWGVRCIERLPEGKELWMLQSKSREWIYLVTTSGSGTQRILDILPVAVNIAVQNQDILETELWITKREQDGSFTIEKTYEWVKSVGNATKEEIATNPDDFGKKKYIADKYTLNEMGRFDFIEAETIPDFQAVFFYFHQDQKPEDWDEVMEIVQSFCEEKNIYFDEKYNNFQDAYIRDFKLNDIIPVDISPYTEDFSAGMVMMQNGKEPKNVNFGSEERMKIEIKRYFKLMNQ